VFSFNVEKEHKRVFSGKNATFSAGVASVRERLAVSKHKVHTFHEEDSVSRN
jgi:hypothetical protein